MSALPPAPAATPRPPARWALAVVLAAALFWLGAESEAIFGFLTRAWQAVFTALGLGGALAHWQQGTSQLVTTRSLPAVASYSLLYVAVSLLLLHVLLRDARRTRQAARVYLALLALYALLTLAGRLGVGPDWPYRLSRRIIDFVVSPLPVMVLLPLLWPGRRQL